MRPKTSLPCAKQPETGPYRELDKSSSRITPDFIMVELVLPFFYVLVPRLVSFCWFSDYNFVYKFLSPLCVLSRGHFISLHLNIPKMFGMDQGFFRTEVGVQVLPLE